MNKFTIYTELLARFLVLLFLSPFVVAFLLFYALGFIAEYFFNAVFSFVKGTRVLIASLDNQTMSNEPQK